MKTLNIHCKGPTTMTQKLTIYLILVILVIQLYKIISIRHGRKREKEEINKKQINKYPLKALGAWRRLCCCVVHVQLLVTFIIKSNV